MFKLGERTPSPIPTFHSIHMAWLGLAWPGIVKR